MSCHQISEVANIPRTTVRRVVKTIAKEVEEKKKGRPKKLSERQVRALDRSIKADRHATYDSHVERLGLDVSRRTLNRAGLSLGFRLRVERKKTDLSESQRRQRLKFCREHLSWTEDDWEKKIHL